MFHNRPIVTLEETTTWLKEEFGLFPTPERDGAVVFWDLQDPNRLLVIDVAGGVRVEGLFRQLRDLGEDVDQAADRLTQK